MYQIKRLSTGEETYPTRIPAGEWEMWDDTPEKFIIAMQQMTTYVDIHERDGDPPSLWQIIKEGVVLATLDARNLTKEERLWASEKLVREGQEILGEMLTQSGRVDDVLKEIEEKEKKRSQTDTDEQGL